jgi:hypothetical protein
MKGKSRLPQLVAGILIVLAPFVALAMLRQSRAAETKQAAAPAPSATGAEAIDVLQQQINDGSV